MKASYQEVSTAQGISRRSFEQKHGGLSPYRYNHRPSSYTYIVGVRHSVANYDDRCYNSHHSHYDPDGSQLKERRPNMAVETVAMPVGVSNNGSLPATQILIYHTPSGQGYAQELALALKIKGATVQTLAQLVQCYLSRHGDLLAGPQPLVTARARKIAIQAAYTNASEHVAHHQMHLFIETKDLWGAENMIELYMCATAAKRSTILTFGPSAVARHTPPTHLLKSRITITAVVESVLDCLAKSVQGEPRH